MQRSATRRGILALVAGIAIFSVQDVILKLLSGDYPLHQAMLLRSLTALPFHVAIVWWFDRTLFTIVTPGWWKMLARGLLNFTAYTFYYLGLAYLPLADTIALFFTNPLFITLAAALLFKERVGIVPGSRGPRRCPTADCGGQSRGSTLPRHGARLRRCRRPMCRRCSGWR